MPGDPIVPAEARSCPDEGACHHDCTGPCWRVLYCDPLSAYGEAWLPFPHLVAAVQAELRTLDPEHGWEVTSGYEGDAKVPSLRVDRTGPERFHPMVNLGPMLDLDPVSDYAVSKTWATMVAQYVVAAGRALDIIHPVQSTPLGRDLAPSWQLEAAEAFADAERSRQRTQPLVNDVIDDPDGTRNLPHPYQPLGPNFSDGFCRRCGRDSRDAIHEQHP